MAQQTNSGIFLYIKSTEMHLSFPGLVGIVRNELGKTPNDGSLCLFVNPRQDKFKAIYWDRGGIAELNKSVQ